MRSTSNTAVTQRVRRRLIALAALALLAAPLVAVAPPTTASAAGAYDKTLYVKKVLDGDTIEVYRSGTSGATDVVRLVAINTNEYPEMCHSATARTRLKNRIENEWVRLTADDANSKAGDGVRFLRFVEHNGRDINKLMIEENYAFVKPSAKEPSRNHGYAVATQQAVASGQRLWNDDACGSGPQQSAQLRMVVNWNAEGTDGSPGTLNGEWVRVHNDGASAVGLNGWKLRNSSTHQIWSFPSGKSIPAGGSVKVFVGSGQNTSTKFYMGYDEAIFDNTVGDGAYLLDPDYDIRAFFHYPCVHDCTDPLQGTIDLSVNADAAGSDTSNPNGEWINLTNETAGSVNLGGYLMRNGDLLYEFPSNSRIDPGERMRLYTGNGNNSRLTKYWGRSSGILGNDSDTVELVTYDDVTISEFAWPCDPCGPISDISIHNYQWDAGTPGPDSPNDEWIELKNRTNEPVDLRDWLLMDNVAQYHFDTSRILQPGAKLRVYIGSGSDSGNTVYWGLSDQTLFSDDMIQVFSPHRDLVACTAWGNKECGPTAAPTTCNGVEATIVGSEGNDVIHGTAGDDVIVALGGNDTVFGKGGNDFICGNDGHDVLDGGSGNDVVIGGHGDDSLEGRSGNDNIKGNGGTDEVRFDGASSGVTVDLRDGFATGEGSDTISTVENIVGSDHGDNLRGDGANNVIDGRGGADTIKGRGGKDTLEGKGGADTIKGGSKADIIRGDSGTDVLIGGSGADVVKGGPDADVLKGKSGTDTLIGNGGPDDLNGGAGVDTLDGGGGTDTCTSGRASNCEN